MHPLKRFAPVLLVLMLSAFHAAPVGTSDVSPMQQLFMIKELKPDVQRVGILWKKSNSDATLKKLQVAGTSMGVKIVLAPVGDLSEIASQFRNLVREHSVDVLWIVEDDDLVASSTGRSFLIKNAIKSKIPLFAPSEDWVTAGAVAMFSKQDGNIHLTINQSALEALALSVPEQYVPQTHYIDTNYSSAK